MLHGAGRRNATALRGDERGHADSFRHLLEVYCDGAPHAYDKEWKQELHQVDGSRPGQEHLDVPLQTLQLHHLHSNYPAEYAQVNSN